MLDKVRSDKKDKKDICLLFFGDWQVVGQRVSEVIRERFKKEQSEIAQYLDGNEATVKQILEALKTKGMFSSEKAVVCQEADNLLAEMNSVVQWIKGQKEKGDSKSLLILHFSQKSSKDQELKKLTEICNFFDFSLKDQKEKDKAQRARELVKDIIQKEGKKISPSALDLFLSLVGEDSSSAIQNELQKLINLIGERERIRDIDVEELVTRHRKEEIFRISEAIRQRDLKMALISLDLLFSQEIPALAILATIRNSLLRILALKIALKKAGFEVEGLTFDQFKSRILPSLKDTISERSIANFFRLHPYVIFLHLKARYSVDELFGLLEEMAKLDLALKGGKVAPRIVMENFLLSSL